MATNGNEPMTDEQQAFAVAGFRSVFDQRFLFADEQRRIVELAERLLAENQRLSAREQALAAENAAMRPIVEAMAREMAVYWNSDLHRFCCHRCDAPPTLNMNRIAHEPDCCYMQARAFIAAHPATDTAAEESEDE